MRSTKNRPAIDTLDRPVLRNLKTQTVKEEICFYSSQYSARFSAHPNDLVAKLMAQPDKTGD
jgi:hypothetical protein